MRVKTERRDKDQGVRRKEKKCVEKVEKTEVNNFFIRDLTLQIL